MRSNKKWPGDHFDMLVMLCANGVTGGEAATAINARFGTGYTRNAVIGQAYRHIKSKRDQTGRGNARRKPKPPPRAVAPAPVKIDGPGRGNRRRPPPAPPPAPSREPEPDPVVAPDSRRVTLMELRPEMCKWPIGVVGASDFGFCGAGAIGGKSYCQHHCGVAYHATVAGLKKESREWREAHKRRL
jgi:GcrA cell cycle regulator